MADHWFDQWVAQNLGLTLVLARGSTLSSATDLIRRFPIVSEPAPTTLTVEDPWAPVTPRVLATELNGWVCSLERYSQAGADDDLLEELSSPVGQAYALTVTQTINVFNSAIDGIRICKFDLLLPGNRYGSDPDRFTRQLTQVGLLPHGGAASGGLQLIETLTGASLSPDILNGRMTGADLA